MAIIGLSIGLSIGNQNNTPLVVNTPITQTTHNNTSKTTSKTTVSNQNNILSVSQAIAIANKYAAPYGEEASGGADYIDGIGDYGGANGDPYYHVDLQYITPRNYGNSDDELTASYVEIDAKTGAINQR